MLTSKSAIVFQFSRCLPCRRSYSTLTVPVNIFDAAVKVLSTRDPEAKAQLSLQYNFNPNDVVNDISSLLLSTPDASSAINTIDSFEYPVRPDLPLLVDAKEIPSPKAANIPLPIYMLHNCAHIELNAIDVFWNTIFISQFYLKQQRQATLPTWIEFYEDFVKVCIIHACTSICINTLVYFLYY